MKQRKVNNRKHVFKTLIVSSMVRNQTLKVNQNRSENLLTCTCLNKNNAAKVSRYNIFYILRYVRPIIYKMFVYKHTETIEYIKN